MSTLTYRNRLGDQIVLATVAATQFKNAFGTIFDRAAQGGAVAITRHDRPAAVLLSYAEFESLVQSRSPDLGLLTSQFDVLLTRMQTSRARRGVAGAFEASPAALGRAAVRAARQPARSPAGNRRAK
jgi:antitoxin Phd